MSSIFYKEANEDIKYGTQYWKCTPIEYEKFEVHGQFYQQSQNNNEVYNEFFICQSSIFCKKNEMVYSLDLLCCVAIQKLYLKNSKQIYGIKLLKNNYHTQILTEDKDVFANFFTKLSTVCILINFQQHYRVMKIIGKGTFSIVYDGYNIISNRIVALKKYSKQQMNKTEKGIDLVKNQIRNLIWLKKFNISPLIQIFETNDCIVLVQHKAYGGDLLQYLSNQKHNYNEELIKSIIKQILQKIKKLHQYGFIHRDLKPENILFLSNSQGSTLYLSDLGLTISKENLLKKNIIHYSCGTLGFVAPQVLNHEQFKIQYNELCDVFSVGCIFYFLCTGKTLFEGINNQQKIWNNKHCIGLEQKVKKIEQMIGKNGLDLMIKLLNKDFTKRISAEQACNHIYLFDTPSKADVIFEDTEHQSLYFIQNKIKKYWEDNEQKI